tara:strand:+ start:161 stop:808 length:648 start_codon:yes stop_codon:yes gene_type:complete
MSLENTVTYTSQNTYSTLNSVGSKTKNIWLVCHGLGYLSKFFINYFKVLDAEENFIVAPQAPSKYYQDKAFKYVGASWLTKENTALETDNVLNYMDAVYDKEVKPHLNSKINLVLFGYSQGVSIISRWAARRKINCDKLIFHSGSIPQELKKEDFDFLNSNCNVYYLYGTRDKYINDERIALESKKGLDLFDSSIKFMPFDGIHEVNTSLIKELS